MAGHLQRGILPRPAHKEQDAEINNLAVTKLASEAVYLYRCEAVPEPSGLGFGP